jgi:hypothetical protein
MQLGTRLKEIEKKRLKFTKNKLNKNPKTKLEKKTTNFRDLFKNMKILT